MAFAFALPAIGSAVLPAIGSVVGGIGSLASAVPVVGGSLGSLLGTGGGGGLAGALTSLGTGGGLGASLGTLGTGIKGMLPALGTHSSGHLMGGLTDMFGGIGKAAGGLYGGADKMLGGLLTNMGIGGTITPQQGYLGSLFTPQAAGSAMQGPQIPLSNQFESFLNGGPAVSGANIDAGLAQIAPGNMGGFFGMGGGLDKYAGKAAGLAKIAQGLGMGGGGGQPGVTQQQVQARSIVPGQVQEAPKPILLGGGQSPGNQALQLGPPTSFYNAAGMPGGVQYQDRVSQVVRDTLKDMNMGGGGAGGGLTPQARSLANTMGARATSMYS